MTLSLAWIRHTNSTRELVIASDSRLRSGCAWDCAPKIFPLPRGDCAICFAGETMYAYPIMEQVRNAISMHPKSATRASDLCDLKGHLLRVVREMERHIHDFPRGQSKPKLDAYFIFAGYSWKNSAFKIWILHYNAKLRRFDFKRASKLHGNDIAIIGDHTKEAKDAISFLARTRNTERCIGFDMEPFEVLRDFCRNNKMPDIGGSPQILKIYKHMNSMPYGVYWPTKASNERTLLGRPLIPYEMPNYMMLDPDTLIPEDYIPHPKLPRDMV